MQITEKAQSSRRHYDRVMYVDSILAPNGEYFGGSYFANYGYWTPETTSARESCENLMEKLLSYVPDTQGTILDVACGLGATTRHLTTRFPVDNITAVDISEKNLETGRRNAPGVTFLCMDATKLEFPDSCFDAIISVEAALHFQTREAFLREALRVLKPGGRLVLSDVLHDRWTDVVSPLLPAENHVESPDHYWEILERAGFSSVVVEDVTEQSWVRSNLNATRFICDKYKQGKIDKKTFNGLMTHRLLRLVSTRYYIVATGAKPSDHEKHEKLGAEIGTEIDGEMLAGRTKVPPGLQVLTEHGSLAFLEIKGRYRRVSRAQKGLAKVCRDTGDVEGAARHMKLSRLYASAARNVRSGLE
jgi:ubiquinone/menaquinone biosynthesis C-methylase UbiE